MSRELHIIGAGGHAAVVADAADSSGKWDSLFVYDDVEPASLPRATSYGGGVDTLLNKSGLLDVVVAIGQADTRLMISNQLISKGMQLVKVIHPRSIVARDARLSAGTVVLAGAIVNPSVSCGIACILNTGSIVDHHCQLGDAVHICPGVALAGRVSIGSKSWIGVGAKVRDGVSIGPDSVIGAGAVVVNNIPGNVTVIGCPAISK